LQLALNCWLTNLQESYRLSRSVLGVGFSDKIERHRFNNIYKNAKLYAVDSKT
jgi:hypothetical protein